MGRPKKILMIDDDEDYCFFVKKNLERRKGYIVFTTTGAQAGIDLATNETPDLILLDILMPKLSGSEITQVLKNSAKTNQIPIVFLTSIVTENDLTNEMGNNIGGNDFIPKANGVLSIIGYIERRLGESREIRRSAP